MLKHLPSFGLSVLLWGSGAAGAAEAPAAVNLLLNSRFAFHSFDNSRTGTAASYRAGAVPCWDQEAYGDAEVWRSPRAKGCRPRFPVENVVVLHPGKRFSQFALLAEMELDHGDRVSLSVYGTQAAAESLQASLHLVRLDSAAGDWSPAQFGQEDKRTFPKHSRGELVRGPSVTARSGPAGAFEVKIENAEVVGAFTEGGDKSTDQPNTIGIAVEFVNTSKDQDVWIYSPCLSRGAAAQNRLPAARPLPEYYRGIPRTIQKLWRGEPLHILAMGSSIDRGSANPPQYLYDEDPASPTYKQPLTGREFDGAKIGRPEWNDYIGWWQHHFMYTGRLRQALMRKFNYPMQKLLLNTMACDGSCIAESHSGFADYASLSGPPEANTNGHRTGKTWQELYPDLFARPEGPRPDLVIFGSGANEKVDGAEEIALFEGAIRWFQRHYPGTEFLFCMFQNRESYTANTGHLMELALRYQIPYIDFGQVLDLATRHCNSYALVPKDGHPQAAGHYLWYKQLERAFDAADPIGLGIVQKHLPDRVSANTIGWEGDAHTYPADDARLRKSGGFILDDTVVNLWGTCKEEKVGVRIDGAPVTAGRFSPFGRRDVRNSTFAMGRLTLGDRHIVEVTGTDARFTAVDAKTVPGRQWVGVESPRWQEPGKTLEVFVNGKPAAARPSDLADKAFASEWGAPYGTRQVLLPAGRFLEIEVPGTDFSVAYADAENGGILRVEVDGAERLVQPTNVPFTTAAEEKVYMENRKGIRGLPYGMHRVRVTAVDGPVTLLGLFTYDTRPNRENERVLRGTAYPGETVTFSAAFKARPLVVCTGGLQAAPAAVASPGGNFTGTGPGGDEVGGE